MSKCDESKPACKRCQASGFCCDFSSQGPMLQLQHAGVYKFDLSLSSQGPTPRYTIPIVLPCSTAFGEYELRAEDFAALDRYRNRTLNHIGTKESRPLFSDENGGLGVSVRIPVVYLGLDICICTHNTLHEANCPSIHFFFTCSLRLPSFTTPALRLPSPQPNKP